MLPLIDLQRQYKSIQKEADAKILEVLSGARYIMGPNVMEFEKAFADYVGTKYAISVGNGTDALVIALKALGIGAGDEVITTSFTFFATGEAISFVGATPVFVDVKPDSYNIDPDQIEAAITEKTKAIMPVHIFGNPADMDEINAIAKAHDLYVIEDAAQAAGASYKGKACGALSDMACFSFFPTKNLGCAGDGGMITTDSEELATIVRALRVHGSGANGRKAKVLLEGGALEVEEETDQAVDNTVYNADKYFNYIIGHNSRLDEIQAALLNVKLPHLDAWNADRVRLAKAYDEAFKDTALVTPYAEEGMIYHMYILQTDDRDKVLAHLAERGIATGVYYQVPMHLQKAFEDLGYKEGDLPVSEYLSGRTFALPLFPGLTDQEQERVIKTLKECL